VRIMHKAIESTHYEVMHRLPRPPENSNSADEELCVKQNDHDEYGVGMQNKSLSHIPIMA